jgi:PEP-CTERM motif
LKKVLLLSVISCAFAAAASAATLSCTVSASGPLTPYTTSFGPNTGFQIDGGNSGGNIAGAIACPSIDAGAGNIVTSWGISATGDYTGGPFDTSTGTTVNMTYSVVGGLNSGVSQLFVPSTPFTLGPVQNPGTQTVSAFGVTINSLVTAGGPVGSSTGQVVINYETGPATPEPATLGLMGTALLGLSFFGRRKKK